MEAADVLTSSTTTEIHWIGYLIEQILEVFSTTVSKKKTKIKICSLSTKKNQAQW